MLQPNRKDTWWLGFIRGRIGGWKGGRLTLQNVTGSALSASLHGVPSDKLNAALMPHGLRWNHVRRIVEPSPHDV